MNSENCSKSEKKKRLETRCASLLALLWRSVKKKHDIIVQSTKCSYFCCQVKRCLPNVPRVGSTLISAVSSDTLHNYLGLCYWNNECACPVHISLEDLSYGLNWLLGKKNQPDLSRVQPFIIKSCPYPVSFI